MLSLRQRAVCASRQARLQPMPAVRTARAFASTDSHSHHDHHDSHAPVDEPMGSAFFIALAAIPFSYAVYTLSGPGKDGEPNAITAYLKSFEYQREQWETRNTLRTAVFDQAAHDRNLFMNADRCAHVELRFPECFQSGSPYNVPAGQAPNIDHVVAHYQEKYHQEVARQAKAAEAAAAKE